MLKGDYKHLAKENENFRKVLYTGKNSQVVLMSIKPGEEIGEETHPTIDQIFIMVDGDEEVEVIIDGVPSWMDEHGILFVPAGTRHNILNKGNESLKLLSIYSPPAHEDGIVHRTKEDAIEQGN
ncbi:MAG: cupin domain-containing protein [Candidatus Levybacteria bacterium]|nr:cupin domain-containing protein [Candidatus Levybacteria bacterium]